MNQRAHRCAVGGTTGVVVGAGQTLNILSPGGTAIDLTNSGTVNGFRLSNSGGEVDGFANFSLMQASGTNAFLFLSGGDDFNAKGATIRALATGSGNTTTVEFEHVRLFNSGTIAAIGSSGANATIDLDDTTVAQLGTGRIVASGNAVVDFSTSIIDGGTLGTVGSNASAGVFDPGAEGFFADGTVAPNTNIGAVGMLEMEAVTFGTNDTVKAYDGGTAFLENVTPAANDKFIASGGSLAIVNDGSLVLKSGTLLLATSNGFVSATADDGSAGMPLRVHAQLAAFQNVAVDFLRWGAVLRRGPAQQNLDAFDQKPMREWFTDEVIGPHFQAEQFIDLLLLRGEKDHR
jgi:hypothetical protein